MLEAKNNNSFWAGRNFANNILGYHLSNKEGHFDANILNAIERYVQYSFIDLLKFTETEDYLSTYCYSDKQIFVDFWNNLLNTGKAFELLGLSDHFSQMKVQEKIHSLNLIKGCYWFVRAHAYYKKFLVDGIVSETLLEHLEIALEFDSYHAACLFFDVYVKSRNKNEIEISATQVEITLKRIAELHQTPGHLLLAKFYFHTDKLDQCLDAINLSEKQFDYSAAEIHNTYCSPQEITLMIQQVKEESLKQLTRREIASIEPLSNTSFTSYN